MKRTNLRTAAIIISASVTGAAMLFASDNPDQAALDALVKGNTVFALDMYKELRAEKEGNLFFSPYSISTALGMTCGGARNNTEKEMKSTLHFSAGPDELANSFGILQGELNAAQKAGDITISIANGIWAEKTYSFLPEFMDLVRKGYGSEIAPADFIGNPQKECQFINSWVERKTNEKIKNILPADAIDSDTRMVLANAIYFKGDWASQFNTNATRDLDFHVSAERVWKRIPHLDFLYYVDTENVVKARMMHQEGQFRYAESEDAQVLELPYKGKRLSMLVLLPKEKNGLDSLEKALSVNKLNGLLGELSQATVDVTFPKFKVETDYDLIKSFKQLGMNDAFDAGTADFSGMDGSRRLYIGKILHKAFVEVDEKGTEAAAATAVVEYRLCAKEVTPPVVFKTDHPFLFFIRDNVTGSILFMGRIVNPS